MANKTLIILSDKKIKMYTQCKYNFLFMLEMTDILMFKVHLIKNVIFDLTRLNTGTDVNSKFGTIDDILIFDYSQITLLTSYTIDNTSFLILYTSPLTIDNMSLVFLYTYESTSTTAKILINSIKIYLGQGYKEYKCDISKFKTLHSTNNYWNFYNISLSNISFGNALLLNGMSIMHSGNLGGIIVSSQSYKLYGNTLYQCTTNIVNSQSNINGFVKTYLIELSSFNTSSFTSSNYILCITSSCNMYDSTKYFTVDTTGYYKYLYYISNTSASLGKTSLILNLLSNIVPNTFNYSLDIPIGVNDTTIDLKLLYYNSIGKRCLFYTYKPRIIIRGSNMNYGNSSQVYILGQAPTTQSISGLKNIIQSTFRASLDIAQYRLVTLDPSNKLRVLYADFLSLTLLDILGVSGNTAVQLLIVKILYNGLVWVLALSYTPSRYKDRFYLGKYGKITNAIPTSSMLIMVGHSVDYDIVNDKVKIMLLPLSPITLKG